MVERMQGRVEPERQVVMPVRRGTDGRWRYREVVETPGGERLRVSGSAPKHDNTRKAAEDALHEHVDRVANPGRHPKPRKEVPTFAEWFDGRFWREWVVARKNKPSERASKRRLYENYIKPFFGETEIDEIGVAQVAQFRASLVEARNRRIASEEGKPLSDKYINNILVVLSKALKYAEDVELIARAPKIGIFRTERPEVVC